MIIIITDSKGLRASPNFTKYLFSSDPKTLSSVVLKKSSPFDKEN